MPEIGLLFDILGRVPTIKFVLKHPAWSEQCARQSLLGNELQITVRVVTAATVRATSPHVNAHVHVAFATGKNVTEIGPISGNLSRGDQILGLPPVVEEDAVAGVEEGPILGVELVLVVERAAHVDGVIPDELARRRDSVELAAEAFQELLEWLEEGCGNGGRFNVDEVAVEVGLLAECGETVGEEGVESINQTAEEGELHAAETRVGSGEELEEKRFIPPLDDECAENGNAVAMACLDPVGRVG